MAGSKGAQAKGQQTVGDQCGKQSQVRKQNVVLGAAVIGHVQSGISRKTTAQKTIIKQKSKERKSPRMRGLKWLQKPTPSRTQRAGLQALSEPGPMQTPSGLKILMFSRRPHLAEAGNQWKRGGGESDLRIASGKEFQASYQRMELSSTNKHTNASSFSPSYTAKDILRADLKGQNPPCGPPRLADGAV